MINYLPTDEAHPAGIGTAPDFMVRELGRLLDDGWQAITTAASWLALGGDSRESRSVSVEIDARRGRTAPWIVSGEIGPRDSAQRPEIVFRYPWDGFTGAEADRVIASLRAFGVLPE